MSTQCSYLYGIMPAYAAKDFGAIGMDGGDVRAVPCGTVAMVTSPAEHIDFAQLPPEKTLRYLAEHPGARAGDGRHRGDPAQIRHICR